MKFSLTLGQSVIDPATQRLAAVAESAGIDCLWVAEAYGADAVSSLGYLAATTKHVQLGTAVLSTAARTPATTAMTAMTLSALSGGRFRLGLGVSGPQVVEGWHGKTFSPPVTEISEYLDIVEGIWNVASPVSYAGAIYAVPAEGSTVKALRSSFPHESLRGSPPVYLAGNGPRMVEVAAARCDGWIPAFYSPDHETIFLESIKRGLSTRESALGKLEISPLVMVATGSVSSEAYEMMRQRFAFFIGGMGSRTHNFYKDLVSRMGFGSAAQRIQDLYLSGRRQEASAAVPSDMLESLAIVGSPAEIDERLRAWEASNADSLILRPVSMGSFEALLSRL